MKQSRRTINTFFLFLFLSLTVVPAHADEPSFDIKKYQGSVVYLDFWASWCVPCRASFPWMEKMQNKYGSKGFKVVTVNLDRKRSAADTFLQSLNVQGLDVIYDPTAVLAKRFEVPGMPTSYLFDRTGKLVSSHIGFVEEKQSEYEKQLVELLEGKQ